MVINLVTKLMKAVPELQSTRNQTDSYPNRLVIKLSSKKMTSIIILCLPSKSEKNL